MIKFVTSTFKVLLVILISFSFIGIVPIYKLIYTDERELIYAVILPFTNPETDMGFIINTINQMISVLIGAPAAIAVETITSLLKNTISTFAALIKCSLTEFDNSLKDDKHFNEKQHWELNNIIKKILDFDRFVFFCYCNHSVIIIMITNLVSIRFICRFVINLSDLYYWKFFLQPILLMYSVTMSAYLYLVVCNRFRTCSIIINKHLDFQWLWPIKKSTI